MKQWITCITKAITKGNKKESGGNSDAPKRFVVDISLMRPKILDKLVPDKTFFRLLNNPLEISL